MPTRTSDDNASGLQSVCRRGASHWHSLTIWRFEFVEFGLHQSYRLRRLESAVRSRSLAAGQVTMLLAITVP
jgi:hypothetical protein